MSDTDSEPGSSLINKVRDTTDYFVNFKFSRTENMDSGEESWQQAELESWWAREYKGFFVNRDEIDSLHAMRGTALYHIL